MRFKPFIFAPISAICCSLVSCGTAGHLTVNRVTYRSIRTEFAQPASIDTSAKIAIEFFFDKNGQMQPVVYNLTDDIMILDQTKSFVVMPDGNSISYYDPTVRTSTTSTYTSGTQGASFNLGGLTKALGVKGPLGALAGATTIGGSQTDGVMNQNTVMITDQPQVNIGPHGRVAMSKAYQVPSLWEPSQYEVRKIDTSYSSSSCKFSVCISYSLDNGKIFDTIVTNMYVSSDISIPVKGATVSTGINEIYRLKPDALVEDLFMLNIPNNINPDSRTMNGPTEHYSEIYDHILQGSLMDYQ